MVAQSLCQPHGQGETPALPEEVTKPVHAEDPQKLGWVFRKSTAELEVELASTEGGSEDESSGEDASPGAVSPYFSAEETLIIFDWDDTVLPTTWLRQHGYSLHGGPICDAGHVSSLQTLAALASEMLHKARQLGKVIIVTNAETGWVELSCHRFLPGLAASLNGLDIVSARSLYESPAARSPADWKRLAFTHQVGTYYGGPSSGRFWNVVVLGDSLHEQQALSFATYGVVTCHAKFVKFVERPDVEELIAEHAEVGRCLRVVVDHDGDLDVHAPGLELFPGTGELLAPFDASC